MFISDGTGNIRPKRDFKKTPEPAGATPTDHTLLFVTQKHYTSHLHYDFRLEFRGILKSWVVPNNLSMDPKENDWQCWFMIIHGTTGILRELSSRYGAGTVIVWDQGTHQTAALKEKEKKRRNIQLPVSTGKGTLI